MIVSSDTAIAMPKPVSGPNSTTAIVPTTAATKSARRIRRYRRNAVTSMRPQTAPTTIAASTARGRSVKNQVNATITTTTRPADVMPVTWLRPPACAAAAVFDRLPATPRPPDSPAAMLAAPMPTSSRSVSTR